MDNVNFNDIMIDDLDLNQYDNKDEEMLFPHIKVETKAFNKALGVAKQLVTTLSKDIVSKSICLKRVGPYLKVYSTDFDNFIEQRIPLLNTEFLLDEVICIPIDTMIKLMKAVPKNLIIYKENAHFKIKLYGGEIILEAHAIDEKKFQFNGVMDEDNIDSIMSDGLLLVMKDFTNLISNALSPNERKIVADKNKAQSNFLFTSIRCLNEFSPLDLKLKDISILKALIQPNEELLISSSKDNAYELIESTEFKYYFLKSNVTNNSVMDDAFNKVNFDNGLHIDFLQLYKVCELSSILDYATGKLKMELVDNVLNIDFCTKKGDDTQFKIEGFVDNSVGEGVKVEVDSKLLSVLLKCFQRNETVKFNIDNNFLVLSNNDYQGVYLLGM